MCRGNEWLSFNTAYLSYTLSSHVPSYTCTCTIHIHTLPSIHMHVLLKHPHPHPPYTCYTEYTCHAPCTSTMHMLRTIHIHMYVPLHVLRSMRMHMLRTIHIHMHMLRTIRIHIHRAKRNHAWHRVSGRVWVSGRVSEWVSEWASEGRVSECTHTPRKKKSHTSACVYISAACTCQHKNIRSPAPHLYTHQHQNNKTPAPAQQNTLISTALTHQNKHATKIKCAHQHK